MYWPITTLGCTADGLDADGNTITGKECCKDIEHGIWFQLGKSMWKKHCSVFDDYVRYVTKGIHKPLKVKISHYAERIC